MKISEDEPFEKKILTINFNISNIVRTYITIFDTEPILDTTDQYNTINASGEI